MREKWKEAGSILLTVLAVLFAFYASRHLLQNYPKLLIYPSETVGQLEFAVVCLAAYLGAAKWIERRIPTEFSLNHALPDLFTGVLGGIVMLSLAMGMMWLVGVYQPKGFGALNGLASGFVLTVAAAAREEIIYRALAFRLCSKVFGTWGGLLLSAAVFVATHAQSPGANFTGLSTVALAGVSFGAAYATTGRLWLPIGLHCGWNFAQSSMFGTAMSGFDTGPGLIVGTLNGPSILTGGQFGPEASIMALIVVFAVAAYLVWRIAKLGRAEPPIWSDVKEARVNIASKVA